jgi:DNA-binding Lrp family transcriptional regulator
MPGREKVVKGPEVRAVLVKSDEPVMTTSQVAEEFEATRPTVGARLEELEDKGVISRTSLGNAYAWYLPELDDRELIEFAADADEYEKLAGYEPVVAPAGLEDEDEQAAEDSSSSDDEPPGGDGGGGGGVFQRIFGSVAGVAIVASVVLWTTAAPAAWPVPGLAAGAIAASVSGADRQLDDLVRSLRQGASARAAEHDGGVMGAVRAAWAAAKEDHPAPADPVTVVERLAWADWYFAGFVPVGVLLTLPAYFVSPAAFIGLLGPTAAFAYVGVLVLALVTWVVTFIVGSLARVAISTSQAPADQAAAPATGGDG